MIHYFQVFLFSFSVMLPNTRGRLMVAVAANSVEKSEENTLIWEMKPLSPYITDDINENCNTEGG